MLIIVIYHNDTILFYFCRLCSFLTLLSLFLLVFPIACIALPQVRGELTPVNRKKIVALITTDVHGRDVTQARVCGLRERE
jgi:hypothetical protein